MSTKILEIKDLKLSFPSEGVEALKGVHIEINKGEILALVGESGSGKSLTALSVLQLQPATALIESGEISFKGEKIFSSKMLSDRKTSKELEKNMRKIRGLNISLIPQDPISSLNPVYTIGNQMLEAIKVHHPEISDEAAKQKAIEDLRSVGIPSPEIRFDSYPHELSGGMRQRVMIAMAITNEPDLIIADEPTTALDVTVQAAILRLLKSLNKTILFITHDLAVVAEIADRVVVMKDGRIVEENDVHSLFKKPRETYTQDLLSSIPGM